MGANLHDHMSVNVIWELAATATVDGYSSAYTMPLGAMNDYAYDQSGFWLPSFL